MQQCLKRLLVMVPEVGRLDKCYRLAVGSVGQFVHLAHQRVQTVLYLWLWCTEVGKKCIFY